MKPTFVVYVTALLLCKYICPSTTTTISTESSTIVDQCQEDGQCVHPDYCLQCTDGSSPSCASAKCVNGKCQIIAPCSQKPSICTSSSQCPHSELCAFQCPNGTSPRCASAKCVNGKCIPIGPCSQRTCKTQAICPYNKTNCAPCAYGYGPVCEQAACSCGICSIVPPCSKRLAITLPLNNVV